MMEGGGSGGQGEWWAGGVVKSEGRGRDGE